MAGERSCGSHFAAGSLSDLNNGRQPNTWTAAPCSRLGVGAGQRLEEWVLAVDPLAVARHLRGDTCRMSAREISGDGQHAAVVVLVRREP